MQDSDEISKSNSLDIAFNDISLMLRAISEDPNLHTYSTGHVQGQQPPSSVSQHTSDMPTESDTSYEQTTKRD
jgi:hypothetical protein